jgi:D-glycero-alpha-D-manno-heptose-7-phosphate kinase
VRRSGCSFCGGGTDVSPYPEEHGGCVLSATINHYAYASLRPRRDSRLTLASLDYDVVAKYSHARRVKFDGQLDLLKAAVKALKVKRGADLWTHSDAPPGSGLGASSTLMVALLAVLREWLKLDLSPYDLAELAYRVERVDLKLAWWSAGSATAASFGGFNYIEFDPQGTVVTPLRLRRDTLEELEYRLLLCYMGQTAAERTASSSARRRATAAVARARSRACTRSRRRPPR